MLQESMGTFMSVLIPMLATALGGVLIALSGSITNYLKQKASVHKLDQYIDILNETVVDVVVGLNQTTVFKLKEAAQDGKLTPEEVRCISDTALTTIVNILGERGVEILQNAFEDLDALIVSKIERAVLEVKK